MIRTVDLTGDYRTTVYAAGCRLLAAGADQAETIETYRGGKLSMSGVIGKAAKWTVHEPTARALCAFSSNAVGVKDGRNRFFRRTGCTEPCPTVPGAA